MMDVFSFAGIILHTFNQRWPRPIEGVQFDPKTRKRVALSEVERRQQYLDKMIGELRPLVEECLDDDPAVRPTIETVCESYMKECPQECITLYQQVEQQKITNDQLRSENEQLRSQMVSAINIVLTLYGILFLVLHKEYTNTTSSQ